MASLVVGLLVLALFLVVGDFYFALYTVLPIGILLWALIDVIMEWIENGADQ